MLLVLSKNHIALLALNISHLFNDVYAKFVPTIMPLMLRNFNLNLAQLGFFSTYAALLSFFLQPLFGILADKRKGDAQSLNINEPEKSLSKNFLQSDLFLMSLGTFLNGFFISLVPFVRSLSEMLIFLTFAAIGNAAFHPASVAFVGSLVEKAKHE